MTGRNRLLREFLFLPALLLFLFPAISNISAMAAAVRFRWQLDREEAVVAIQGWWLSQGRGIYLPIDEYPLVVGTYAPVYPLLVAFGSLLGLDPLFAGRLIVVISAIALLILIGSIAYRASGIMTLAMTAPLAFACCYEFLSWGRYARVDFPSVFFSLLGVAILLFARLSVTILLLSAVSFFLAVYTKQTAIFGGAAAGLWLLSRSESLKRPSKEFQLFTVVLGGAGILTYLGLQFFTSGEFHRNAITANANVMDWWSLRVWMNHLLRFSPFLVVGALGALVILTAACKKDICSRLSLIYTVLILASFPMIAKRGSAENYLLELQVLLALLPVIFVAAAPTLKSPPLKRLVYASAFFVYTGQALHYHGYSGFANPPLALVQQWQRPLPESTVEDQIVLKLMATEGDVLSEEPILTFRAGREVLYHPFIMTQLASEGKWDQREFLGDLRSRRFAAIVSLEKFTAAADSSSGPVVGWSEEARKAIATSYRLAATLPHRELSKTYYLYFPGLESSD